MIGWHLAFGGIALFWLAVLSRVRRSRQDPKWRLGPEDPVDVPLPRLLVIVPARDEAAVISDCVRALRASDHPDLDVLVYDDGSTDGTGALAEAAGARVSRGGDAPLPEGWKGKPHALWHATRDIDADWILFVDADVRVRPEALSRAHARAIRDQVDFLSGFGRLGMESFWEKVIQPSVGGLILAGNDLDAVNDPARPDRVIANGQFILVRRAAYEAVGGHAAVKADILDDVGLARAFTGGDFAIRVFFMRELFDCRMYTDLRSLWYGWTKNLYAGMGYRLDRVAFLVGFVTYEFLLMWAALAWGVVTGDVLFLGWGLALVLLSQVARLWLDRIFGQDVRFGLLQPLGALALVGLLIDSARRSRRGAVVWKGRTYAARPEDAAAGGPPPDRTGGAA